jgi:hypothetical protein
MRKFETGATRDDDTEKYDYEGFLHPLVIERFGEYMHKHRHQADGELRDSDNWQKGMPKDQYIKSLFRHFVDLWKSHRGYKTKETKEELCCAIMFNVMGYLSRLILLKNDEEFETKDSKWRVTFRITDDCNGL